MKMTPFPRQRRVIAAAAVLAGALVLQGSATGAQPSGAEPRAGLWEYSYRYLGLLPVGGEKRCLKDAEIDKFFEGPCNRHHTCTYPTKVFENGKIELRGKWVDKRGREAPVNATGSWTATTVDLSINGRATTGLPLVGSMKGKWVAASCPAGTPGA